jgi:hypothetical protein
MPTLRDGVPFECRSPRKRGPFCTPIHTLRGPAHQHLSGEPLVTLRCAFVQFPPHLGQLALELHNLLLRIGADALLRVGLMRSP